MAKYQIIFARRVDQMLIRHMDFLTRVSIPAAKAFYKEFEETLGRMAENPYQFSAEEDRNLPDGQYRKALFAKRYKAIFLVESQKILLDAVIDCRMENKKSY